MEAEAATDTDAMMEKTSLHMQIDPKRARFPYCIVWTPLPIISWLVPFIGHVGICREDGVILDFAGPNFVCVDNFAFGAVARYIQINKEKVHYSMQFVKMLNFSLWLLFLLLFRWESFSLLLFCFEQIETEKEMAWDDALRMGTQEFQHKSYSLFTCNCHSFVANNLNRMSCSGHNKWNVVNLATLIFLKGRWVNKAAIVRSLLPFVIIFCLGLLLGGWTFLIGLACFASILVGWFLLGTYCFKNLIQL